MVDTRPHQTIRTLFPFSDSDHSHITKNVEFYRRRFNEDAPRLFSPQSDHFKSLCIPIEGSQGVHEHVVEDIGSLATLLRHNESDLAAMIHFFQQCNSWSRFTITKNTCEELLASHNVFLPFLDCLHSFGFKTEEDSRIWDGFHARTYLSSDRLRYELCYTVRYFERNNRGSGNPWSLRQTGVYQQLDTVSGRATWIFLQAGEDLRGEIQKAAVSANERQSWNLASDSLRLHNFFIMMGLNTFSVYIEVLQLEVTELGYKALFSSVAVRKRNDFVLNFLDVQKLQALRQKLVRVLGILKYYEQLIRDLQNFMRLNAIPTRAETEYDLEVCASQTRTHIRRADTALTYLDGTADLLSKILVARQDETLLYSNKAMEGNLATMQRIAFESHEENRNLAQILAQGQKDSKILKVLTLIATMYLPASLIATIFSSDLIQMKQSNGPGGQSEEFEVAKEFWIYILITTFLTGATLLLMYLLYRPWKR